MSIFYLPYTILSSILFILSLPWFWAYTRVTGRYSIHFRDRLGLISENTIQSLVGRPRIWMHAVSLGEVKVAASIIDALKAVIPECSIILSTITESGRHFAEDTFGKEIPVIYAPIDFVGSVRTALSAIKPDVMVFLETEIWPIWLREAHQKGIKVALVNGRISPKSVKGYLKARFFFSEVLANFDAISMITNGDADRIEAMGADPQKIEVNGSAKYDLSASMSDPAVEREMRRVFNLAEHDKVFIAGSTRHGEEEIILDAYDKIRQEFPDMILIFAPRHIERVKEIRGMFERREMAYQLRTELNEAKVNRTRQIVIVDTLGELFNIYSIGTIVFAGGSLLPFGGQNPLEPAVWKKPVFFGPYMDNFKDAQGILEAVHAGITVKNADALAEEAVRLLRNPEKLIHLGERAREAVLENKGAAERHARVVKRLFDGA